jgi:hypothetical protein
MASNPLISMQLWIQHSTFNIQQLRAQVAPLVLRLSHSERDRAVVVHHKDVEPMPAYSTGSFSHWQPSSRSLGE